MLDMKNKGVLVTGGGLGIGRAIAVAYAKRGASVLIADINSEAAAQTVELINKAGGVGLSTHCDVTKEQDIKAAIDLLVSQFGSLDFACNNAGIHPERPPNPFADIADALWDSVMDTNLKSVFRCMKYELKQMEKQATGAIVNIASMAGLVTEPESPAYTASKHGVMGLTKAAAFEYAKKGIRINAVCPGPVETPMLQSAPEYARQQMMSLIPAQRFATPEEVAEAVVWLSSASASYINGVGLPIDGAIGTI